MLNRTIRIWWPARRLFFAFSITALFIAQFWYKTPGAAASDSVLSPTDLHQIKQEEAQMRKECMLDPGNSRLWGRLAVARRVLGDIAGSKAAEERALTLNEFEPAIFYLRCQKLMVEKHYVEAELQCKKAIEYGEDIYFVELLIAESYFARKNYNQAQNWGKKAVERFPNNFRAYIAIGKFQTALELHDDALRILRNAKTKFPDELRVSLQFAESLKAAGKLQDAAAELTSGIAAAGDDIHRTLAHYQLGELYRALNQPKEAISHLLLAVERDPSVFSFQLALVYAYYHDGDYDGLENRLELIAERFPNDKGYQLLTAIVAARRLESDGKVEQAKDLLTAAIAATPDDPHRHNAEYIVGELYRSLLRPAEAVPHFKHAIKLNPNSAASQMALAYAYFGAGNFKAADEQFDLLAKRFPSGPGDSLLAGVTAKRLANFPKALTLAETALAENPKDWKAHHLHGLVLSALDQPSAALKAIGRAYEIAPDDSNAFFDYVKLLSDQRHDRQARAIIDDFLSRHPDSPYGLQFHGLISVREGKLAQAESAFLQELELQKDTANVQYNLACVKALQGNTKLALSWLKKAIEQKNDLAKNASKDPDLRSLYENSEFIAIIESHGGEISGK